MASGYNRLSNDVPNYGSVETNPNVGFAPNNGSTTEFFQLCDRVTTHLFTVNNAASSLDRSLKQIGTPADNQHLRDRITHLNSDAGSAVQETPGLLRTLHQMAKGDRQRRVRSTKLQNEFQACATRFSEVQKRVVSTVRSARLPSDMVAAELDSEAASDHTEQMVSNEQKLQKQKEELQAIEFETAMQLERETSVRQLETDIVDINDIMRELSSMVETQGELVDTIESNVEGAHGDVEGGREELAKAAVYQNKARRRLCYLILFLLIVLAIIATILAIHFSSKK